MLVGVGGAQALQLFQQLARFAVGEGVAEHIQHRVAQAGGEHRVADIVHVQEAADVRLLIGLGPRRAQLLQRVRAEAGEHQQATGLQHAHAFGEQRGQVVDPLEAQVGVQHVDAVVGQRQRAGFGAHAR